MSQFYLHPAASQSSMNPHATFPNPSSAPYNHHNNNNNHHHHHNNHHNNNNHNHHHGHRSRRTPRYSNSQNSHKQYKNHRNHKAEAVAAHAAAIRRDFEAARSFDLEDDETFCPWHLLTEDDLQSIHSSSSERSSSSGDSPDSSPMQPQLQPQAAFHPVSAAGANMAHGFHNGGAGQLKIHQPLAQRARAAIPIVDPNSRDTSPPTSISPARQMQKPFAAGRRM